MFVKIFFIKKLVCMYCHGHLSNENFKYVEYKSKDLLNESENKLEINTILKSSFF